MPAEYSKLSVEEIAAKILREHLHLPKDSSVSFSVQEDIYVKSVWRIFAKLKGQDIVLNLYDIKEPEDLVIKQIYFNELSAAKTTKKRRIVANAITGRYAWFIVPQN